MGTGPDLRTTLVTCDGVPLAAAHRVAGPGYEDVAIVVVHGFTGSMEAPAVTRVADQLRRTAGVVTLSLRGHGASGGRSTLGDLEAHDVEAAVAWARELGYAKVATVGFSLGSACVVRHGGVHGTADAVVAVSGPSRWYYQGTRPMRTLHRAVAWPLGPLLLSRAYGTRVDTRHWDPRRPETWPPDPTACAARIAPRPLLVVHGDRDRYFPLDHAEALYAAAGDPRELWVEHGYGHAEGAASPELVERIGRWVRRALRAPGAG
ncbi:alpha/beta hydrolase family protein [Motilibacter rhizosphaerae]|uniref:Alpha/beta hydrolase family protein n=1 Tax=Motilibacter rhizosphaerae TaxID=598652 RepID=A0A4V2F4W9_9ACTN|nr:alpha/beta hydrolase family protein [Motilibacter rhizosphaerae]